MQEDFKENTSYIMTADLNPMNVTISQLYKLILVPPNCYTKAVDVTIMLQLINVQLISNQTNHVYILQILFHPFEFNLPQMKTPCLYQGTSTMNVQL